MGWRVRAIGPAPFVGVAGRGRSGGRREGAAVNRWEPPGGILELGETIEAGVVREVLEETGLTVHPERLTGVYENLPRGIIALVLRCALVDGTPKVTEEAVDLAWLSPGEIQERMAPAYACRLIDALSPAGEAVPIRPHDGRDLLVLDEDRPDRRRPCQELSRHHPG